MNERRNSCVWPLALAIVVVLFLLPVAYMGSYYAMLKDQISLASPPPPGIPFDLMLEPVYRLDSPIVEKLLEPAHQIDRMIRPHYWH